MKILSIAMAVLWPADPWKPKWTLIAKAWSVIRDEVGKDNAPLDVFLSIVCPLLGLLSPSEYMDKMGWSVSVLEDGQPIVLRKFIPEFDIDSFTTTLSVEDLVKHCRNIGYIANVAGTAGIPSGVSSTGQSLTMIAHSSANAARLAQRRARCQRKQQLHSAQATQSASPAQSASQAQSNSAALAGQQIPSTQLAQESHLTHVEYMSQPKDAEAQYFDFDSYFKEPFSEFELNVSEPVIGSLSAPSNVHASLLTLSQDDEAMSAGNTAWEYEILLALNQHQAPEQPPVSDEDALRDNPLAESSMIQASEDAWGLEMGAPYRDLFNPNNGESLAWNPYEGDKFIAWDINGANSFRDYDMWMEDRDGRKQ